MSGLKRFLAVALAIMMILSVAACRSKDDVAFTFKSGDQSVSIRSAIYIAYMLNQSGIFQQEVANAQIEQYSTTSPSVDFDEETITNKAGKQKGYDEFVTEETQQDCAEFAYVQMQYEKLGLKLTKDMVSAFEQQFDSQWASYAPFYEANGVYEASFKEFFENDFKRLALYDHIYGDGGEKAPAEKELKKALGENYVLAQTISVNFTNDEGVEMTKKEKKKAKAKFDAYLADLQSGAKTFADVYKDYYPNQTPSQTETKDIYSSPFGGEDTQMPSSYYKKIKKMKQGVENGKVLEFDDCYMLVIKTDIFSDDYYFDNLKEEMRDLLVGEEFNDFVEAEAKKLEVEKDTGVINYYTPDNTRVPDEDEY